MTIRARVVGAFLIVLALLVTLGINSMMAITAVDREAADVEAGMTRTDALIDYNVKVRATLGLGTQYASSGSTRDLDSLNAATINLAKATTSLRSRVPAEMGSAVAKLNKETETYLGNLQSMIEFVGSRERHAADAFAAMTDIQVIAPAIAERVLDDPEARIQSLRLVADTEAAGISTFRYRSASNPADIDAAKRWFDFAKSALHKLDLDPRLDPRVVRMVEAIRKPMSAFEGAMLAIERDTLAVTNGSLGWKAAADSLLTDGTKYRLASGTRQREALTRMLLAIAGARTFDLVGTVLAIVIGGFLAVSLVRSIAFPLVKITEAMRKLAAGALETAVPMADRDDEVGAMAKAVGVFREGLIRVRRLDSEKEEEGVSRQYRIECIESLNSSFEIEVESYTHSLSEAAAEMIVTATALREIATQTNGRSAIVAAAAEEASANVRRVAASTAEVSASVSEISRQVTTSTLMAGQAVGRAKEADVNVRALVSGAQKIGSVVGLIRSIAQETNLLALNATIEAARAGEAGRGFAVVAGEVKQLAVATSKATEEIGVQIAQIQDAMKSAAGTIDEIGLSIGAMNDITTAIAGAVEEQSTTIALITSSASKAAAGADEVSANIADVKHASSSTDAAAQQVFAAAESMTRRAGAMNEKVGEFLMQIRQV